MSQLVTDNVNCRKWILRKIKDYERLLNDMTLTPRLESRLAQAKEVFESSLKLEDTNIVSLTKSLRKLDKEIEDNYRATFGSIQRSAELLLQISAIQSFIRLILFDEYGQDQKHDLRRSISVEEYVITGKVLSGPDGRADIAKRLNREDIDDPSVTENMMQRLRDCAKEMLLSVDQLSEDVKDFAHREGRPRRRVRELITQCRWQELADKLEEDRIDLQHIVPRRERSKAHPKSEVTWPEDIAAGIAAIERQYFDSLEKPCKPNARARRLTEKKRQPDTQPSQPQNRHTISPRRANTVSIVQRPLPPVPQADVKSSPTRRKTTDNTVSSRTIVRFSEPDEPPPSYAEIHPTPLPRSSGTRRASMPTIFGRFFGSSRPSG